jgi:two-component system, OmpR family, phosphate regulon sensor histidine kinase PhoR
MARKRLFRQLYLYYLFIIVLSLTLALLFSLWALRDFYYAQVQQVLETRARLLEGQIRESLARSDQDLNNLCRTLGKISDTRITVVRPSGQVVADSHSDPAGMDNHGDRPEIQAALDGRSGAQVRFSHTLGKKLMYVAVPLQEAGNIVCAVRTSMPVASLGQALEGVQDRILFFVVLVALAAMSLSLFFSRQISHPIEEMKQGALQFAQGDLASRLHVPDSVELGGLAEALNDMAAQLHERIRAISRQRGEREAILSSMAEGVIAVNAAEKIISINQAAAGMLGLRTETAQGKSIQEVVRNAALHELVALTLSGRQENGCKTVLETAAGRSLQANGAILRDVGGERIGAVIVLNDITQLKKLENHRREFVANVSHELRTPITSIQGFVETLLDGALKSPEDAERFLKIIARQVNQLNAIIQDLLVLSRIEQDGEKTGFKMEAGKVREVLESAIEVCSSRAVQKDISIGLACQEELTARMHFPLLTQAVVNLLDNAINFSAAGSDVQVGAGEDSTGLFIRVQDQGCGIPEDHLPRLTERFYRVDKARSRKMGGTGLGLAIVKHIVQSHRGTLSISSQPGRGSTFTLHLPKAESD